MKGTRKFFSILTALALCLSLLPGTAWAAETPTRTGTLNLTELDSMDKTEDEGWKWEITGSNSGTLTLTNCYIQADTKDLILFPAYFTLTIILVGDNTLETTATLDALDPMIHGINEVGQGIENEVHQIIQGDGTLQIKGMGKGYGFGGEDLTVQSGTITSNIGFCKITNKFTMSGGSVTASGSDYGLYIVKGPVDISNGELDLQGTSCGIYVSGVDYKNATSVNISGGTVKAIGGSTAGIFVQPDTDSYALNTSPQAINISGGSLTAGGGTAGLYARDVNVSGGSVSGNGGKMGLYATESVSISGSKTYVNWQGASSQDIQGGTKTAITGSVVKVGKISESVMPENAILFVGTKGKAYGNASLSQNLTIPAGSTLTIPQSASLSVGQGAVLTNEGTVQLEGDAITDIPTYIQNLKLAGDGRVVVQKGSEDGSTVEETYTNEGKRLLAPAGDADGKLDLSNVNTDEDKLDTQGYKWEVTKETGGNGNEIITSAKLTLAEGFNATTVILPDTAVEIMTMGESSIGTLTTAARESNQSPNIQLTFSGSGKLTLQKRLGLDGNTGDIIISRGAYVIAEEGIVSGDSGGHSSVTVNGTLEAKSYNDGTYDNPALFTGKVAVGDKGVLEVSGAEGVLLHGVGGNSSNPETDVPLTDMFTVEGDGRFTADCSTYNMRVVTNNGTIPSGTTVEGAIPLDDEYMPDDCEVKIQADGTIDLVKKGTSDVYTDALTIHKNHQAASTWEHNDTHHWHPCIYPGCDWKDSEAPHFYRSCVCTVCGYRAPAGTPDSDSGSSGGDSGSSSGGSSHETTYTVIVEKAEHGKVTSDHRTASLGRTVTLTVSPDEGYETGTLTVTDRSGKNLDVTDKGGGTYTFIMPGGNVSVRAVFNKITADYEACARDSSCPIWPFVDADANAWYHDGIHYCLGNGLMSGYGDHLFGPNAPLSRAQFAQILHNCEGRPAVNYLMQFVDVSGKEWYTEAVRWAASEGVVSGYGNGMFGPDDNITREQLALMLWRYAGSPAATEKELEFSDTGKISDYAIEALQWAVENGIVTGGDGGVLDPQGQATRAEAAAMLMRYLGK